MPSIYDMVNRKLNKSSSRKIRTMPKRKESRRRSVVKYVKRVATRRNARGFLSGGLSSFNGVKNTLAPYALALGMGTIFVAGASKVKPDLSMQNAQYVGLAGEYIGGGFKGLLGAEILKTIMGVPSALSGILGKGSSSTGMQTNSTAGWA